MPAHILVVEDDDALRYWCCKVLETAGYITHAFPDYRGVLTLLDDPAQQADLLVVDIFLPSGTPHGLAVAGMARMRRRDLPIIFMTAYPDFARHIVDGYTVLVKPIADNVLLDAVAARLLSA